MAAGIGIIAATAATASAAPAARGGDSFAAGGARLGRVFTRLRGKPRRIDLGRIRRRRGGGLLGRVIFCARFRRITRRRIVRRLRRRACPRGFRVLLLCGRGVERGGEKLFVGNQRGDEERPSQKTERAGSLVGTLRPGFEYHLLLFEQFALFYFVLDRVHDRHPSSRSTQKQLLPGSIHCRASLFGASSVMPYVVRLRWRVEMSYVEVIRRAHLADGVIERMVGRH
jgi:hypothetical protein